MGNYMASLYKNKGIWYLSLMHNYTGAKSGEIRHKSRENILDGSLVVSGKTGHRYVKLNTQTQAILQQQIPLWSYRKDYV